MKAPTVWAPHMVEQDTTSADQYGTVAFINTRYVYGDEIQEDGSMPSSFLRNMRDAVSVFDPQLDYLLLVGDHLQLVALSGMLVNRYGAVRVLRYDRLAKGYIPIKIHP